MSRATTEALRDAIAGLTLTDAGLVGSPLSLSGRVHLLQAVPDALPRGAAPVAYLRHSGARLQREGIQGLLAQSYELALILPLTTADEGHPAGAEVLAQLVEAASGWLIGGTGYVDEVTVDDGRMAVDRDTRELRVLLLLGTRRLL